MAYNVFSGTLNPTHSLTHFDTHRSRAVDTGNVCVPRLSEQFLNGTSAPCVGPVPSGILIHPTVWPQYTNVTDRQTGQLSRYF